MLLGASGVFGQLQDSLNTIWEVQPKPGRGFFGMLRDRFFSFAMVLGVAFLLLVSLVISAGLAAVGKIFGGMPESAQFVAQGLNFGVSFIVLTLLFAAMYKWVPDVKIDWRDVWLGAAVTALLFSIGKFAIGLYLGHSAMASSYGVAGSFVVLLVWVYYSTQILFFGAEITQVYANQFGNRIVPTDNAEPVPAAQRANEGNAATPQYASRERREKTESHAGTKHAANRKIIGGTRRVPHQIHQPHFITARISIMTVQREEKFQDLLEDFDVAMLVTRTSDGELRSRPMAVADVDDDGTLWLMTQRRSPKTDEIARDDHVNLSMQSMTKFVSSAARPKPVDDRRKVAELWNESWKTWFPGGKDDPNLQLLRVRGHSGEYWDNSGMSGIKYLIEAGKAYFSGTRPDVEGDPKIHGKVEL